MTSVESPQMSESLSDSVKTSPPRFEAFIMTGNVILAKTNSTHAKKPQLGGERRRATKMAATNNVVLRSPVLSQRRSPGDTDKENEGGLKGEYVANVFEASGHDVHGFTLQTVVLEKGDGGMEVAVDRAALGGVDIPDSASPVPTSLSPISAPSTSPDGVLRVPTPGLRTLTPEALDERPVWTINDALPKGAPASPRRNGRGFREYLKEETIITDTTISEVTDTKIQSTFLLPSPRTPRHGGDVKLVERNIEIDVVNDTTYPSNPPSPALRLDTPEPEEIVSVILPVAVDQEDVYLEPIHLDNAMEIEQTVDRQGNFVHPESARACMEMFPLDGMQLDEALRVFLAQVKLVGETQARLRVVDLFAMRFVECNRGSFYDRDAANAVVTGMLILNSDLHSEHRPAQAMNCRRFIASLRQLPACQTVPDEELERLYYAIKNQPLPLPPGTQLEFPERNGHVAAETPAVISYQGYLYRKSCTEPGGKPTRMGKRGWHKYYVVIHDLSLDFFKKEPSPGAAPPAASSIPLHHGYAVPAADYRKRRCVLRLQGVDGSVNLLQAPNEQELRHWLEAVNRTAALFSAPVALPVGSQTLAANARRFSTIRPLYPTKKSVLSVDEQLEELRKCDERLFKEMEALNVRQPGSSSEAILMSEQLNYYKRELERNAIYQEILTSMT